MVSVEVLIRRGPSSGAQTFSNNVMDINTVKGRREMRGCSMCKIQLGLVTIVFVGGRWVKGNMVHLLRSIISPRIKVYVLGL